MMLECDIWKTLDVVQWLPTKYLHHLSLVFYVKLTLALDTALTMNFGHSMSRPKFNRLLTSNNVGDQLAKDH